MSRIPISDEETRVIFAENALSELSNCQPDIQKIILKRLLNIADNVSPPDQFVYKQIANVDIIRAGDETRLYSKVVTNIPEGNSTYHIIYVLHIDPHHEYDRADLATFSGQAQTELQRITNFENVSSVEEYLAEYNALSVPDLKEMLE